MANKQINELTAKTDTLVDDDLIVVYDSDEAGSEKAKKVPISDYVATINSSMTVYVDTGGNDTTGDGTSGNPWATPNKALEWINKRVLANYVTIQVNDGTYSDLDYLDFKSPYGRNYRLKGNTSTPSNVVFNFKADTSGAYIQYGHHAYIQGIKFVGYAGNTKGGIRAQYHAGAVVDNCIIDNFYYNVYTYMGSHIILSNGTTTNAEWGVLSQRLGGVLITNSTVSNNTTGVRVTAAAEVLTNVVTYSGNTTNEDTAANGRITAI